MLFSPKKIRTDCNDSSLKFCCYNSMSCVARYVLSANIMCQYWNSVLFVDMKIDTRMNYRYIQPLRTLSKDWVDDTSCRIFDAFLTIVASKIMPTTLLFGVVWVDMDDRRRIERCFHVHTGSTGSSFRDWTATKNESRSIRRRSGDVSAWRSVPKRRHF